MPKSSLPVVSVSEETIVEKIYIIKAEEEQESRLMHLPNKVLPCFQTYLIQGALYK